MEKIYVILLFICLTCRIKNSFWIKENVWFNNNAYNPNPKLFTNMKHGKKTFKLEQDLLFINLHADKWLEKFSCTPPRAHILYFGHLTAWRRLTASSPFSQLFSLPCLQVPNDCLPPKQSKAKLVYLIEFYNTFKWLLSLTHKHTQRSLVIKGSMWAREKEREWEGEEGGRGEWPAWG